MQQNDRRTSFNQFNSVSKPQEAEFSIMCSRNKFLNTIWVIFKDSGEFW